MGFEGFGLEVRVVDEGLVSSVEGGEGVCLSAFSGSSHPLNVSAVGHFMKEVIGLCMLGCSHCLL